MNNTRDAIPPFGAAGVRPLRGLEKVCKLYGRMKCGDVMMVWDYVNEVALPEKELRADKARLAASEKAKWSNDQRSDRPSTPDHRPGGKQPETV